MQKSRRIAKKTGDKGKETRRFDNFVITGRSAFINRETGRLGRPVSVTVERVNFLKME